MKSIIIKSSYPEALKSYNFVWNINIFNHPPSESLQTVSCFILGAVPEKMLLLYFFKFIHNMFWGSSYELLENNF